MILSPVGEAKRQELAFPNGSTEPVPVNNENEIIRIFNEFVFF